MIAEVIVDIATSELDRIFDYTINSVPVKIGSRVIVPFGNRKILGFVINIKEESTLPNSKLKPIIRLVEDIPALTKECLDLANYISTKYHISKSLTLRLFLTAEMRKGKVREKFHNFISLNLDEIAFNEVVYSLKKNAEKQKEVLNYLKANGEALQSELGEKFSPSTVSTLIKKGYATVKKVRLNRTPYKGVLETKNKVELTSEQKNAIEIVKNSSKPTLIHGVTGSGKTEIYLSLIEECINDGKTAIMLVPEIALTPQMFSRLRGRFGNLCAILHSGLSAGEKFDEWWRLRSGEAKVAIGARSAIFAPLENIGVIIIDEEHEQSYESETSPRYVTSELALFRAKYNNAKLVLGSATPKIESYLSAVNGEFSLATLTGRVNKKPMPEIIIADMRNEIKSGNVTAFSKALKYELEETLNSGNQAIIFLNRRGYSQKIICRECGYVAKCAYCDVSLTYHRYEDTLKCHYCGATYKMPSGCPDCGSVNINYSGTGTQKVVEDLNKLFPNAKILRMDNDTTQNKEGHYKILKEFGDKKADILVGTQMIAKGHDFPKVTLVGILDGDMSLYFSDYRASERTFQLITQVAGRSGRADKKGKVVLQTFSPKNTVLNHAIEYDYNGFFNKECSLRKASHFPPFALILRLMVESDNDEKALETLKNVFYKCKEIRDENASEFIYFNKMKSPVKRINNKYRYQVLARIKTGNDEIVDSFYRVATEFDGAKVRCYLEVNPNSLS
ncbi:MAG: primosomal protein N' [Clostridia bacterium]|nr:primosomal protein N' [Clostridia bacterium]